MALRRITKADANFSMSSMTDIVFLLLIFFLVTSTLVNPNALKLLLPKSTGQVGAKATASVSIKQEIEKLGTGLNKLNEEDPTFAIYSDESVPVGEIVQVMNIAKRNHYKVILATQAE